MSYRLYTFSLSPFGMRVKLSSAFTGIPVELADPPGAPGSDSMKAISVFGQMPAIETGGRVLIQSLALMEFLAEQAADSTLIPASLADRAGMRGIILAHDEHVVGAARPALAELRSPRPSAEAARPALLKAAAQLDTLTRLFDEHDYAIGVNITLADIALAPHAVQFEHIFPFFGEPSPYAANSRLARWWQAFQARSEAQGLLELMHEAYRGFLSSLRLAQQA